MERERPMPPEEAPQPEQVRRQVPEHDPELREARERQREGEIDVIFGERGLHDHDKAVAETEAGMRRISELEAHLGGAAPLTGEEEQAVRREIEGIARQVADLREGKGNTLRSEFQSLAIGLARLQMRGERKRPMFVLKEMEDIFTAPVFIDEARRMFGDEGEPFDPALWYEKISAREFSDEALYSAAARHFERMILAEREMQVRMDGYKAEFAASVRDAISAEVLPESAARSLDNVRDAPVRLVDMLSDVERPAVAQASMTGTVFISSSALQPEIEDYLRSTMYHEFLHVAAGKSYTLTTVQEGAERKVTLHDRKSGLLLRPHEASIGTGGWLNEAVTESLALRLSGYYADEGPKTYRGSASYADERRELDRLYDDGVDERAVVDAYFEHFEEGQAKGEKGARYAAMTRRIAEVEGAARLSKIENGFVMREVAEDLYSRGALPAEEEIETPEGAERVEFDVTLGRAAGTAETRRFVAFTSPAFADVPAEDAVGVRNYFAEYFELAARKFGHGLSYEFLDVRRPKDPAWVETKKPSS